MQFPLFQKQASAIGLDFHNHLLPGVDDGVKDVAEAIVAIRALKSAGFTGAVITPHIYRGIYDNNPLQLRAEFSYFVAELSANGINFPLMLAAEYFADEFFLERIKQDDILYLQVWNERWVLIEFPYYHEDQYGAICISALAARGYRPIIAHVERYRYVAKGRTVWLSRFARAGAILQADIGSLAGQHGEEARRFCRWLLAENFISLWGSDLHKAAQVERFIKPGLKQLSAGKQINKMLDKLFTEHAI